MLQTDDGVGGGWGGMVQMANVFPKTLPSLNPYPIAPVATLVLPSLFLTLAAMVFGIWFNPRDITSPGDIGAVRIQASQTPPQWILTAPISPGDVKSLGLNQIPNTIAAKFKNSEGRTKVGYGAIG